MSAYGGGPDVEYKIPEDWFVQVLPSSYATNTAAVDPISAIDGPRLL
jgi:hypothetical protein